MIKKISSISNSQACSNLATSYSELSSIQNVVESNELNNTSKDQSRKKTQAHLIKRDFDKLTKNLDKFKKSFKKKLHIQNYGMILIYRL